MSLPEYYDGTNWITVAIEVSILHGYVTNTYNTDTDSGDHFKFDGIEYNKGNNITLDTTTTYTTATNTNSIGRITLAANKNYKLFASLNNLRSRNTSRNVCQWYNVDNGNPIGLVSIGPSPRGNTQYVASSGIISYINTTSTTRVELRIIDANIRDVNGIDNSEGSIWFTVEEFF